MRLLILLSSDIWAVDVSTQSFFGLVLTSGICLFRYNKGMMHAKTMIIDDEWGTIGSVNLDSQSFVFNYEANIITKNRLCIAELKASFLKDIESSTEVQRHIWEQRPFIKRLLEPLTWPMHIFL